MNENYNLLGETQGVLPSGEENVRNLRNKVSIQKSIKKSNWFLSILLLMSVWSSAQVTTNGGSGLAPTYTSLANAITALNAATITSPVVITLTGNETAPLGGFNITAQGTATNTIIVEGVTSVITAPFQTAGQYYNAIFKLVGADYVTIRNFTMVEHGGTQTTNPGTNNMTEWGVALLYASTTNGAQNNTIQGNTISLNRNYLNSFGIYSNATHAETTPGTNATATSPAGSNTGLSVLSNTISNVNMGIAVVGPTAAANHNQTLTIGGAGFGNTITDFGTNLPTNTPVNVSGSSYGVLVRNTANYTISHNTITSSNGGYIATSGTQFKAIYIPTFSNAPTGTLTQVIDYNSISMRPGASVLTYCIHVETGTGSADTSLSISHNDFTNSTFTTAGSNAAFYCIINRMGNLIENMNSNTFTNLNVDTTNSVTFIDHGVVRPANAICNVNNNTIVGTFTKSAGGSVGFYFTLGSPSPTSVTETFNGNNFSNITLSGATAINYGFSCIDGSGTLGSAKTVTNNTFSNITGGSGNIKLLVVQGSANSTTSTVANNTIANITGGGAITGIESLFNGSQTFENNTIHGLTSSGAATVTGMSIGTNSAGVQKVFKNKIYNLENTNAAGSVNGINLANGTTDAQNNFIGDLRTPNADGANLLNGINIAGTVGAVDVSNNTVWLTGGSVGTNFGSSAISVLTTRTVTLRNNIFVNKTTPNGTGLAAAYRRSDTDLTNYAAASNSNLFFGSTIFTDGTNTDATLAAYKVRVAPMDAAAVTEDPPFLSTVGANANFLHIDTTIPTWTESRGTPISGITIDFDGDTRNATTPDIGADEMNGTCISTSNSTAVSACDTYTWSTNGATYTATGIYNHVVGCHTETLDLTINTATTPTGASTQVINGGVASDATIEDIVVSGTGIVWYPTALDAANGTNPIAAGTQLVDGEDYFAVSVNGSCTSVALVVTVTVVLGNETFDLTELNYYPNPVIEIFNVRYNKNITSVQIFDVSGRMVKSVQPNSEIVEINLSKLSPAMYIVKLQSEDGKQAEIKIFKK